MRAKPLYREALEEALQALLPSLAPDTPKHEARALCASVVRAYTTCAADLESKRMDGRISPATRALAALEVGEAVILPAQPSQCIRGRFPVARQLMGNPDATWRTETLADKRVKVWRRPDGASGYHRDPTRNRKAVEMASLAPGQSCWSRTMPSTRGKGQMGTNAKVAARRLLGAPLANWTVRTVEGRVKLTRLA